jgi:hypothetical protein
VETKDFLHELRAALLVVFRVAIFSLHDAGLSREHAGAGCLVAEKDVV